MKITAREYFEKFSDKDFDRMVGAPRYDLLNIRYEIDKAPDGWDSYDKDPKLKKKIDKLFRSIRKFHEERYVVVDARGKKGLDIKNFTVSLRNYFLLVDPGSIKDFPLEFKAMHDYLKVITDDGYDWQTYKNNEMVRDKIDKYITELNAWIEEEADKNQNDLGALSEKSEKSITYVNALSYDQVILYKYVHFKMQGDPEYENVRELINYIRRLLVQKKIGNGTRNIGLIKKIQDYLLACTRGTRPQIDPAIKDIETLKEKFLLERLKPAVLLLKRYIGLSGRDKEGKGSLRYIRRKAEEIYEKMLALDIRKSDTHYEELQDAIKKLESFLKAGNKATQLPIVSGRVYGLSGLSGILGDEMETEETLCSYEDVTIGTLSCTNY